MVTKVIHRLENEGLAISPTKQIFHVQQVEFLRYVLSDKGVAISLLKVVNILSRETTKSIRNIKVFIGFANFYQWFIKNFSVMASPITRLTNIDLDNSNGLRNKP